MKLAELCGARIECRSQPGHGTIFTVALVEV